jgi:mannose-6-phosphate isomerase-like protein (cupin superfamily)
MMILMRIERWDVRRDGALTDAALLHKLQALGYEPVRRAYPAGAMAAATIDNRARVEAVISGLIKVTVDEEPAILTAGDMVFIPPRAARRIEVVGTTSAFCFEASRDLS